MKHVELRPYATSEAAAARLFEIAKAIGADRRGIIPVGAWSATFFNQDKATASEYALGRDHLIEAGSIEMEGSGGYILWGPNCALEDRTDRNSALTFPAASLGLLR
jgi:hypothetical protein